LPACQIYFGSKTSAQTVIQKYKGVCRRHGANLNSATPLGQKSGLVLFQSEKPEGDSQDLNRIKEVGLLTA